MHKSIVIVSTGKKPNWGGGGSEGGLVKDHTFPPFFFEPFPKNTTYHDVFFYRTSWKYCPEVKQ